MSLPLAWLVFPLVLAALSLGCGLFLEQVGGRKLPGPLVVPSGFAVVIVITGFATASGATAKLATPAVSALAVAGMALTPRRRVRVDAWAIVVAVAVFAVYAAPIALSGQATFAGYIMLDDTATWLALTDRLMDHGRSVSGLPPSTYRATLSNLSIGYPVGANLPLGIGGKLLRQDIAWLFQPYMAFLAAMLGLGLYGLLARLIPSRRLRAPVAFVAAQPALLYAYSLWGGLKELAAAGLIVLLTALVAPLLTERIRVRELIPLAAASAGLLAVLSVGGLAWLAALAVPMLALVVRLNGRIVALGSAAFVAFTLALSVPSILTASVFLRQGEDILTSSVELGNLVRPLRPLQLFGIWPTADFRIDPGNRAATYVLVGVLSASALIGLVWAVSRRAWALPMYVGAVLAGATAISNLGSPWVGAKAFATASPALVLAGLTGAVCIFNRGRRIEAAVVTAAIAGGVLWSNALAYHGVWLAPRGQLAELEAIGKRFTGQGPTLMTEYQVYGVRHFLRDMDAEGAAELRVRPVRLRDGGLLEKGGYADLDEFALEDVLVYRTLVLRRSPALSRPPSPYLLAMRGRYYDVWQRPEPFTSRVREHLPLGDLLRPAAPAPCRDVLRLAALASEAGGRLATVIRPEPVVVPLSETSYPAAWQASASNANILAPIGSGTLSAEFDVPVAGRYETWLGGSFRGSVVLQVDGRSVGAARHRLNNSGQYTRLGEAVVRRGTHFVTLRYGGADLHPGSGSYPFAFGPIVLSRAEDDPPVTYVEAAQARNLCGRRLDWIEALGA
jgi:hypothetical protein